MANSKMAQMKSIIGYDNLCDELLVEIFLRLPTKSAVRLQVVCKRWYSLISSPYFIDRFIHLRHDRDVESSLVFQIRYYCDRTCNSGNCRKYHYDFKTISNSSLLLCNNNASGFSLDYLPCSPSRLQLKGSFDDLILCSYIINPKQINYYVINLLTTQWIALPPPPVHEGFIAIGFLCVPPPCSECKPMDTSHYKFMVVRLSLYELPCSRFNAQLFSSEDGQWRTLVVSSPLPLRGSFVDTCPLVAYRGMLHWITHSCIVVYDPLNTPEACSHIIHLPIRPASWKDFCFKLCFSQGHLRVVKSCIEGRDHVVDVWELQDYDFGSWNLVHKVYLSNLIYDDSLQPIAEKSSLSNFRVVSLHPDNGDVIYMKIDNGIALVNMKTRIVERYYPLKKNATIEHSPFHLAHKWWPTQMIS